VKKTAVLLVVLALLTISFSTAPYNEYKEVGRFRDDFTYYFKTDTHSIDIRFVDEMTTSYEGAVGYCYRATNSIEILRSYWKETSPIRQQMLIFHELGHCLLGKKHSDAIFQDGCGASIMLFHLDSSDCYYKHYNELIAEFLKQ
jgi:hypothetical protein